MVPEANAFVAVLANATDRDEGLIASTLMKIALGIDLTGPAPINLSTKQMEQFIGVYEHNANDLRRIRLGENGLQSQRGGGNWYDLVPIADNRFMFASDPDTQITFTPDGLVVSYRYGADHIATRI